MKKTLLTRIAILWMVMVTQTAMATDYTTFLTTGRGFTEVTSIDDIIADANYYYILAPEETHELIVGIGKYESKPGWASEESKALRYHSAATDPVLDLTNFFTIEKSGSHIGLRNVVYNTDLFQTHDNAGYMYVNTFTDKTLDEWSYLTPTYQEGYWLFESGHYPVSSGNWACGYLGPWNNVVKEGEAIALNRRNTQGDEAGHYRLFRIARRDLYLNTARGFTEVTSTDDILTGADHCYLLASAENTNLIVGVGRYEEKPDWASEDTKALHYRSLLSDPALTLSNFFTIEKSGQYIGLRNLVYDTDLFQTHDNAGYMYVNTFTDKTLDDWSYLTPTYQNGYWLFENGKYPMSSDNWACGYLGPWNKVVKEGEPIALNRRNTSDDEAGHYRLFHISRADLMTLRQLLAVASDIAPVNMTANLVNPSFETGDETGWTLIGKDVNGNDEFKTRAYNMSGRDGNYLMNAYQWWATNLSIKQIATEIPAGIYELTAVVASWEGRTVKLTANNAKSTATGIDDGTGVPIALTLTVDNKQRLIIEAGSTTDWWTEGRTLTYNDTQCFFKIDDLQLKCKGFFLNAVAAQLPNDPTTLLLPDQWYYYDAPYNTQYQLIGQIDGMVYSTDGATVLSNVTSSLAARELTLGGRVFFKTTRSDATLSIVSKRAIQEGTFTAVALNVDGLPKEINYGIGKYALNPDGPGADGTLKISQYLASKNYDFIGCSEDFNYNGSLMESLKDNYSCGTIRNTLSLGDLDYGDLIQGKVHVDTDGLNLIWKFNKVSATNESWTSWSDTESTDGNQYVEKGYRHYDMQLDGGPAIDVFILHMDAGDTNATWSRESQWRQLAEAINNSDHNRAKLIIGDTNSRYTREDVITNFIDRLSSDFTMGDVWVDFYRDGIYPTKDMDNLTDQTNPTNYSKYEIVDKIIYINPKAANTVHLVPQTFCIEQDYTYDYVDHNNNTTPLGDHRPVVVTFKYQLSGDVTPTAVTLLDDDDNTTIINNTINVLSNVTLQDRTLYRDNSWNTLCLPFNAEKTGDFADATLMELDTEGIYDGKQTGFDASNGILYLFFKNATSITAGKPYIVKWASGGDFTPTFNGVTITSASPDATVKSSDNKVQFLGSYSPVALTPNDKTNLFIGADNTLYYPDAANNDDGKFYINAFRAYFHIDDAAGVRSFVLNLDDEESTEIRGVNCSNNSTDRTDWYTLDGRKLLGKPTTKGLYIANGKKIAIP